MAVESYQFEKLEGWESYPRSARAGGFRMEDEARDEERLLYRVHT